MLALTLPSMQLAFLAAGGIPRTGPGGSSGGGGGMGRASAGGGGVGPRFICRGYCVSRWQDSSSASNLPASACGGECARCRDLFSSCVISAAAVINLPGHGGVGP